jgi:hypothetical protein
VLGELFAPRRGKLKGDGENYTVKAFRICTVGAIFID